MEQENFDQLLLRICKSESDINDSIKVLYKVSKRGEIRDFQWESNDNSEPVDIYTTLYKGFSFYWKRELSDAIEIDIFKFESMLADVWHYLSSLPEFNYGLAANNIFLTENLVTQLFSRIASISVLYETSELRDSLTHVLQIYKYIAHWTYSNSVQLRPFMKLMLSTHLLLVQAGAVSQQQIDQREKDKDHKQLKFNLNPHAGDAGSSHSHVTHFLDLLYCVIAGFGTSEEDQQGLSVLLKKVLLPLHLPNKMVAWRDQVPVIQSYHQRLVQCLIKLIEKSREIQLQSHVDEKKSVLLGKSSMMVMTLQTLLEKWPDKFQTNTPKQVLLIHELEMLMEISTVEELSCVLNPLLERLAKCIGSEADNIRPAQRALQIFKNHKVVQLLVGDSAGANGEKSMRELVRALHRMGVLSWNPTVNKMTALALKNMEEANPLLFKKVTDELFKPRSSNLNSNIRANNRTTTQPTNSFDSLPILPPTQQIEPKSDMNQKRQSNPISNTTYPEKAQRSEHQLSVGGSRPPGTHVAESKEDCSGKDETANFAQWQREALDSQLKAPAPRPSRPGGNVFPRPRVSGLKDAHTTFPRQAIPMLPKQYSKDNPPPVTVTGVAPWAQKPVSSQPVSIGARKSSLLPPSIGSAADEPSQVEAPESSGYGKIREYMKSCYEQIFDKSNTTSEDSAAVTSWAQSQAAPTPTLLPELKFHDLVFGRVLGEGAFSTVKYARHVNREKTQSAWAEYAVKIISAEKITTNRYQGALLREVGALRLLAHPGVARLVSSFRYSGSAYLVLEYASKGDIHSYLVNHGKISHEHTRFVIGEVAAAVSGLHELGFAYGDLKPENVLITELNHIKITDFGGCRPITDEARRLLDASRYSLTHLRSGDWRTPEQMVPGEVGEGEDLFEAMFKEMEEDDRLEGTPAYLPPELLLRSESSARGSAEVRPVLSAVSNGAKKGFPGFVGDSWALGCLTYFCLHGRPLFYGDVEQVLQQVAQHHRDQLSGGSAADTSSTSASKVHFANSNPTSSVVGDKAMRLPSVPGAKESAAEGGDLEEGEVEASVHFISQLTQIDPSRRSGVEQVLEHPYLTRGSFLDTSKSASSSKRRPMEPRSLHKGPSVPLPAVKAQGGGSGAQWARRQFSVLWAPMPEQYSTDGTEAHTHHKIIGDSSADVWLMEHPYQMTAIPETEFERGAPFLPPIADSDSISENATN